MRDLLKRQIYLLLGVAGLLIAIEVINLFTGRMLGSLGVIPRVPHTLPYIFSAPFVHGNLAHLASNLIPLMILMWLTMQWGRRTFWLVTLTTLVISGLAVWIFGRHAIHIGASGMVYGYFGFLVLAGFMSKKITYILVSLAVAFTYGSMVFGVLPGRPFVSFEYHLFGMLAGLACAKFWGHNIS